MRTCCPPTELSAACRSIEVYLDDIASLQRVRHRLGQHQFYRLMACCKRHVHRSPAVQRVRSWAGAPPYALPVAFCSYT